MLFTITCTASAATAATVSSSRTLPAISASPGIVDSGLSIHIEGPPPNGLIVKEYVPVGWTIASAFPAYSSFDSATGLVEWVIFGGNVTADIHIDYQVQIPENLNGSSVFQGYVLFNDGNGDEQTITTGGVASLIVYSQQVSISRSLPATFDSPSYVDVALAVSIQGTAPNGLIIQENLPPGVALVSANPIYSSFDIDTRVLKWVLAGAEVNSRSIAYRLSVPSGITGSLGFSGSAKYNDPTATEVTIAVSGESGSIFAGTAQSISTTRTLPGVVTPGSNAAIFLAVFVGGTPPSGLIVKEFLPAGWQIVASTPAVSFFDAVTGEAKWLFSGAQVVSRDITYTVAVPGGASGDQAFSGALLFNDVTNAEQTVSIVGDADLRVKSVAKGDVDADDAVDLADAVTALKVVCALPAGPVNGSADVNADDRIGIEEVAYILQRICGVRAP